MTARTIELCAKQKAVPAWSDAGDAIALRAVRHALAWNWTTFVRRGGFEQHASIARDAGYRKLERVEKHLMRREIEARNRHFSF